MARLPSLASAIVAMCFQAAAVRRQKPTEKSMFLSSNSQRNREINFIREIQSDPFAEIPMQWVHDAARDGVNFSMKQSANASQSRPSALLDRARTAGSDPRLDDERLMSALTSVECQGSEHTRSCAFKNLYFNQDEGGFFVFTLDGAEHPDFHSVLLLHKWSSKGSIKRKNFASLSEFNIFLNEHGPTEHDGLSLIYDSIWHHNIGHAIWDGLYPAFLALCEWGRQSEVYRSVVGIALDCKQNFTDDGKCMSEGVFRKFGGGEFLPYPALKGTGWHRFADSIAGSGRKGQRSINPKYALPGGRDLDGARLFRNRMYSSHGLQVPQPRNSGESQSFPLKGIIINNKRFSASEREMLKSLAADMSMEGHLKLKFIDFGADSLRGNFKNQLEMFGKLSVHISGPGTAQAYEPFLPDGSAHLNLGDRRNLPGEHSVSFLEEVWSEGVPYLRAFHYDPLRLKPVGLERNELDPLIRSAVDLVQKGFEMPVPQGLNLSPTARVFKDYCAALGADCDHLMSLLNGDKSTGFPSEVPDIWWCNANAWAENLVFEVGGWSEAGQVEDGKTIRCLLNRKLLRQIRAQHLKW